MNSKTFKWAFVVFVLLIILSSSIAATPTLIAKAMPAITGKAVQTSTQSSANKHSSTLLDTAFEERATTEEPEDTQYVRRVLKISALKKIQPIVVQRLIQKKQENFEKFNKVMRITVVLAKNDEEKEELAGEMLEMHNGFIERFTQRYEGSSQIRKQELKSQVERYMKTIETKSPPKLIIQKVQIKQVFNKSMDLDHLMDQLWNS